MKFIVHFFPENRSWHQRVVMNQNDLPMYTLPELQEDGDICQIVFQWLPWDESTEERVAEIKLEGDRLYFKKFDECPIARFNEIYDLFYCADQRVMPPVFENFRAALDLVMPEVQKLKSRMKYVVKFNNHVGNVYSKSLADSVDSAHAIVDYHYADQAIIFRIHDDRSLSGVTYIAR